MKNVTLSVDEQVLRAVRRYAAEHGSSLNRLVRDYLGEIAGRVDRAAEVRQRLRRLSDTSPARIGDRVWRRDDLHGR